MWNGLDGKKLRIDSPQQHMALVEACWLHFTEFLMIYYSFFMLPSFFLNPSLCRRRLSNILALLCACESQQKTDDDT